jgi:hypothetical protein
LVKLGVLVGNPKPRSRTLEAGVLVAKRLTGFEPSLVIDVVDLGSALLEFGNKRVVESIKVIQQVDVLIVASPTYKATYTGILKLYLDQIPPNGLSETAALPLMLGAGPSHAMAPNCTSNWSWLSSALRVRLPASIFWTAPLRAMQSSMHGSQGLSLFFGASVREKINRIRVRLMPACPWCRHCRVDNDSIAVPAGIRPSA